jgi:hypothetical protein
MTFNWPDSTEWLNWSSFTTSTWPQALIFDWAPFTTPSFLTVFALPILHLITPGHTEHKQWTIRNTTATRRLNLTSHRLSFSQQTVTSLSHPDIRLASCYSGQDSPRLPSHDSDIPSCPNVRLSFSSQCIPTIQGNTVTYTSACSVFYSCILFANALGCWVFMKFARQAWPPSIQPHGKSRESLAVCRLLRTTTAPAHSNHKSLLFPLIRRNASTLPMPIGSPEGQSSLKVALNRVSPPSTLSPSIIPLFPGSVRLEQSPVPMFPLRDSQHLFQYTGGESWRSKAKQCRLPGTTMANTSFARPVEAKTTLFCPFRLPIGGYH